MSIDVDQLGYFAAIFAVRMYSWDNYRRGANHWDILAKSAEFGIDFDMRKRRVGVPYRLLNKGSVWLFLLCQACATQGNDASGVFFCVVMNIIVMRTWWNNRVYVDRFACVMCHWLDDCVHGLDRFACVMCHWLDDCVHGPDGPWF